MKFEKIVDAEMVELQELLDQSVESNSNRNNSMKIERTKYFCAEFELRF